MKPVAAEPVTDNVQPKCELGKLLKMSVAVEPVTDNVQPKSELKRLLKKLSGYFSSLLCLLLAVHCLLQVLRPLVFSTVSLA